MLDSLQVQVAGIEIWSYMQSGGLRTRSIIKRSEDAKPLITVVTVVRNSEKTLEQTILSVLNQTYNNVEYIIVDGASTDGTLDIIKKYEDKIDYWISEPDTGLYYAMNKGIAMATGDYVAMLNSNDWYELNACEVIAKKITEKKADIYYGLIRTRIGKEDDIYGIGGNTIHALSYGSTIMHPTCFVSKEIYYKFKYNTTYKIVSDYELIVRLYKNNATFCFIEAIIANFRLGGISSTNDTFVKIEKNDIMRKYGFIAFKKSIAKKMYLWFKFIIKEMVLKKILSCFYHKGNLY